MTREEMLAQARSSAQQINELSDRARESLRRDTDWSGARQSGYHSRERAGSAG
jgi:hypothetical protein